MLAEVKKCAENNDIKGLRYVFLDCLDVDPTFEKYEEDYNYCKNINGFFDLFVEMTPLLFEKSRWDMKYWEQLKLDLVKNFSSERFEHMIDVAKVVYAGKISRLLAERGSQKQKVEKPVYNPSTAQSKIQNMQQSVSQAEMQEQRIREKQRQLELQNQKIEEEQRKQRSRIEAAKRSTTSKQYHASGTNASKKWLGIVLAVAVIVVIVLLLTVR